jgi:predicted RecB family nuclease
VSEKEILKLNKKGIFTVTQLSHTYCARRSRRKRETIEKHSPALKALAIRDKKIYVTRAAKPQMGRVQIFFDVEGIPDKDFYYLIGAKVIDGANETTHSFWADNALDEEKIWKQFLSMIAAFDSFSLLHFGGYESAFVARMLKRYGTKMGIYLTPVAPTSCGFRNPVLRNT